MDYANFLWSESVDSTQISQAFDHVVLNLVISSYPQLLAKRASPESLLPLIISQVYHKTFHAKVINNKQE